MAWYYDEGSLSEVMKKPVKEHERIIKMLDEFDDQFIYALMYGTADEMRELYKKGTEKGYKIDLEDLMKLTMWHAYEVDKFEFLKELGYKFEGDEQSIYEFVRMGVMKPELARFLVDNGAVVDWNIIKMCASRYDADVLRIFLDALEK